jgi:enoyl-CoA hydratase/carnithine racemase
MRDALSEGLALAVADDSIEEVVLAAAGPSFCSGGDLDEFGSFPDPATAHAVRSARSPARLLALCAARARAEVHGACVGAGCELPAFCRRVSAREDSFFQLPEVGMGLVPGAGGTASLPARIGRQRTAWLALTGRRIDAATALAWGLVDAIQ